MTTGAVILVLAAFLASAVEAVEALTVVLAIGVTRGWRASLIGAGTATLALAALIAAFGWVRGSHATGPATPRALWASL